MSKHNIDMTKGPVFSKLLRFAIPVFLTNLLQQLYSVADTAVVGKFDANGTESLAAVGGTSTLTTLLLLMFTGIATGAGVVVAQHIGAGNDEHRTAVRCFPHLLQLHAQPEGGGTGDRQRHLPACRHHLQHQPDAVLLLS